MIDKERTSCVEFNPVMLRRVRDLKTTYRLTNRQSDLLSDKVIHRGAPQVYISFYKHFRITKTLPVFRYMVMNVKMDGRTWEQLLFILLQGCRKFLTT